MLWPNDPDFKRMVQVKRGRVVLAQVWDPFLAAFAERFGVTPFWVELHHVDGAGTRLDLVFTHTAEARVLAPTMVETDPAHERTIRGLLESTVDVDVRGRFWVMSDEFESGVVMACSQQVSEDDVRAFEESLGLGEWLWLTDRTMGNPVVMVQTIAQVEQLESQDVRDSWVDRWYRLAKTNDEFNLLTRERVTVSLDSKENFDTTYSGSWRNYYL